MKDIKEVANILIKTANYHQLPIEEVFQWLQVEIIDMSDSNNFHYELKNNNNDTEKIFLYDESKKIKNISVVNIFDTIEPTWQCSSNIKTRLQKVDNYLNGISIKEYDKTLEDAGINKNNFDLKNNKTICELIEETLQLTNDEQIINNLLEIKEKKEYFEEK